MNPNLRQDLSELNILDFGSLQYLGPKIWELPTNLQNLETITAIKRGIKRWKPEKCPCRQCKTSYLPQVGFT